MRDYGQIQCALWANPRFKGLSEHSRLLFAYLLTGPHSNGLGCYPLPKFYVCADHKWELETVSEGFTELFRNGFIYYCETTEFVFIRGYLKWNPIANKNVAKAREREFSDVPGNFEYLQELAKELLAFGNHWANPFANRLETVTQTVTQTRTEPNRTDIKKKSTPDGVPKENPPAPQKTTPKPKPPPRTKTVTKAEMRKDFPDLRDQTIDDWLAVRKAKRAPLTPTAWEACVREINQSGLTGDQAVKIAAIRGWQGIKADWLLNHISGGQTHGPQGSQRNNPGTDQHQDNSLAARVRRGSEERLRDMGCSEDEIRRVVGSND